MPHRANGHGKPIVASDLDGTWGNWHAHFLEFAALWTGKPMPPADQINPGLRLHKFMGIKLAEYRACKLAFRQGGLKRWMPLYPGAAEFSTAVRKEGAEFWICTTRPYNRLDNIDPDTQENLRRNGVKFDGLLYGEDKYRELRRQVPGRVVAILEDLPEMVTAALKAFKTDSYMPEVYLRDQPYNQHFLHNPRFSRMEALRALVLDDIRYWKDRQK